MVRRNGVPCEAICVREIEGGGLTTLGILNRAAVLSFPDIQGNSSAGISIEASLAPRHWFFHTSVHQFTKLI